MLNLPDFQNCKVGILGLGYVGLPLALQIAKTFKCKKSNKKLNRFVVGFDINKTRINELKEFNDKTEEYSEVFLKSINRITYTTNQDDLVECAVFIITVPTPIDKSKKPDLSFLKEASKIVAKCIKKRKDLKKNVSSIVIYESTVYPGVTEDFCLPILEKYSSLKGNLDFYYGYSPERINPGDKIKTINNIVKLTSGSDFSSASWIDNFYSSIIEAGTYMTKSIKIAEAAKIIENTQRDINIALINELSIIFNLMNIDTLDVLDAAKTKWNFLDFSPGLVGGHCIGVDPYYLTYKAQILGYYPEMVLSGRRINDGFGIYITDKIISLLIRKRFILPDTEILILGMTFKENCSDIRNTKVKSIIDKFNSYGVKLTVVDPLVDLNYCKKFFNLNIYKKLPLGKEYDAVLLTVAHKLFCDFESDTWKSLLKEKGILFDLKGIIPRDLNPIRL